MNVLVIAAHPDDEVLGCGGVIANHVTGGDSVNILILGEGETSRIGSSPQKTTELKSAANSAADLLGANTPIMLGYPDNKLDTIPLLEIIQEIEKVVDRISPSLVYTHHHNDLNNDHTIAHKATVTACRPIPGSSISKVLMYEVLSSSEWGSMSSKPVFSPNYFSNISGSLEKKLQALSFYGSEIREFPHPRSHEAVAALAKLRGASCGVEAAEAFELLFSLDQGLKS